jgi:sugar phosphate isomerase/epimerase
MTATDPACSTLAFTGLPLPGALARIRALGFTAAELVVRGDGVWPGHLDPVRLAADPGYGRGAAAALAESGLALASAGCEQAMDLALAEECRRIRALAAWLAAAGARLLTVLVYDHDHGNRWRELDAIARDHGLVLAAETHLGTATAIPAAAVAVAARRGLRLTLDASHYIGQGFTPPDWAPLLDRVVAVQVRHCRPGELQEPAAGVAAIRDRLPDLMPRGFAGPVVCEQIANPGDPDWSHQLDLTRQAVSLWQAGPERSGRPDPFPAPGQGVESGPALGRGRPRRRPAGGEPASSQC